MNDLTNTQREALINLLDEKVKSLLWYAGQCFYDTGNQTTERFTKEASFWFAILNKLRKV